MVTAINLRVRFNPPETEEDALREKDNIIERLQRVGYDVEPMGLDRHGVDWHTNSSPITAGQIERSAEAMMRGGAKPDVNGLWFTLDSLEHILFGDVQKRSRDELEQRAAEAICAWNERPA